MESAMEGGCGGRLSKRRVVRALCGAHQRFGGVPGCRRGLGGGCGLCVRGRTRQERAQRHVGLARPVARGVPGWRHRGPRGGAKARYIVRAPYTRWKEVLAGDLDPVKGMMQGKLKLQGDLPTIIRYVRAANELIHLTTSVPTEFLDEPAGRGAP